MAITVRVVIKDFNDDKLQEELASLPIQGITWAGFIRSGERLHTPFPEDSRVLGTSSSDGDDVALRGELRFFSPSSLTAQENTALDSVLQAHDSAVLSSEQVRSDQDEVDFAELLATDLQVLRDHRQDWDSKTNAQKFIAMRELLQVNIKMLRLLTRLPQLNLDFHKDQIF